MEARRRAFWIGAISGALGGALGAVSGANSWIVVFFYSAIISLILAWGISGFIK